MKKCFNLLALLCLVFIVSCSDDDSVENQQPQFSVDINGETFTADMFEAFVYEGVLSVQALDANNDNKFLITISNVSEGTFTPNSSDNLLALAYEPFDGGADFVADPTDPNSGSLTITDLNIDGGFVSGTFNFTATEFGTTFEMTNGEFTNIPISEDIPPFFQGGSANFDLNGQAFNPTSIGAFRSVISLADLDRVTVSMRKSGSPNFQIFIPTDAQPGTYVDEFDYRVLANQGTSTFSGSRTITITENNQETRNIKGTFEAVLDFDNTGDSDEVFNITNGEFDIIYEDD